MQTFPIRRIRCGKQPNYAWVTVWYNVGGRKLAVLHIVCDAEDRKIYMEGDDQMIAAWGGAKQVRVSEAEIEFVLTKKATTQLYLPAAFALSAVESPSGWTKARKLLHEMAGYPSGSCISVDEAGTATTRKG